MDEKRVGLFLRILGTGERTALTSVLGILKPVLIGDVALGEALYADAEAGSVHHDEHGCQPLVLFADHIARCAIVIHYTGCLRTDAHLVLDRPAAYRVPFAQRAISVHQHFWNNEQRYPLARFGSIRRLGENEMDDVFRQVVLTARDEDFRACDGIAAIGPRHGACPNEPKICAGMRFGEVHCPAPFTGNHLGQVQGLLLVRTLDEYRSHRAHSQPGIHAERLVCGHTEFFHCRADHVR